MQKSAVDYKCSYLHTCTTPALHAQLLNTPYDTRVIKTIPGFT